MIQKIFYENDFLYYREAWLPLSVHFIFLYGLNSHLNGQTYNDTLFDMFALN